MTTITGSKYMDLGSTVYTESLMVWAALVAVTLINVKLSFLLCCSVLILVFTMGVQGKARACCSFKNLKELDQCLSSGKFNLIKLVPKAACFAAGYSQQLSAQLTSDGEKTGFISAPVGVRPLLMLLMDLCIFDLWAGFKSSRRALLGWRYCCVKLTTLLILSAAFDLFLIFDYDATRWL